MCAYLGLRAGLFRQGPDSVRQKSRLVGEWSLFTCCSLLEDFEFQGRNNPLLKKCLHMGSLKYFFLVYSKNHLPKMTMFIGHFGKMFERALYPFFHGLPTK